MLDSLWKKFLVLLFLTSMVSLSAALVLRELIIKDFREYLEGEMEDRVYWVTADLEGTYEKYSGWKQDVIVEDTVWALLLGLETRIRDRNGAVIMDTGKALDSVPPSLKRRLPAISAFRARDRARGFVPYPLFLAGEQIGVLEVRFLHPGKESIFVRRSNQFLLFSLLALGGLSVVLSVIFSRRLAAPINKLTHAAKAVSEGDLKSRVVVSGNDEIRGLADAFNHMAHALEIQESLRRRLTSNIAHELRTPLAVMRGEIEGMMDGLIPSDRDRLLSLHEETGRLKRILDGIEELSAAEAASVSLSRRPVRLRPYLKGITGRFMKLFLDKGVILELDCDEDAAVEADPEKLSQVIMNLLSNALKATQPGGRVRIEVRGGETGASITVRDSGCGIRREDLPFVFERFYKASQGGLGLGLAIAKEVVQAHGGTIEARSEHGKGSVFTVHLPSGRVQDLS